MIDFCMKIGKAAVFFSVALMMLFNAAGAENLIGERLDVDLQLVEVPQMDYKRGAGFMPRVDSVNRWLMIKVWFTVKRDSALPVAPSGAQQKMFFGGAVDDVELQIRVVMDTHFKRDQNIIYCQYSGRTEFYSVRCDGKKHLAVMFVPSKLIDRFSLGTDGQIRKVSKKDFKAEAVMSKAGQVLARGYCNVPGSRAFEKICLGVPENLKIDGGVFPRSRTPWALIAFDSFDLEKEPQVWKVVAPEYRSDR